MAKLENLSERDIEWIITAVDAIAALPSSGLPGDNVRHEEWKGLAVRLKDQAPQALDASEVYDDFISEVNVKPGDVVTIAINGEEAAASTVVHHGTIGLLKKRTLDRLQDTCGRFKRIRSVGEK